MLKLDGLYRVRKIAAKDNNAFTMVAVGQSTMGRLHHIPLIADKDATDDELSLNNCCLFQGHNCAYLRTSAVVGVYDIQDSPSWVKELGLYEKLPKDSIIIETLNSTYCVEGLVV